MPVRPASAGKRMRIRKSTLVRIALTSVAAAAAYTGLLCAPQPLFPFSVRAANLTLYSDRPIPAAAGQRVLELAGRKLAASPLYFGGLQNVFICNSRWRQLLLFNKDYGVGGVAFYPISGNVF